MFATEAILIRKTRLTDTSLIVHWFTEEEGLVKTVVKGALRPKSIFAGKLDLFFSGEISVLRARRGELHILRELVISNWRQGLRRNYESTLMAGYFCQLVEAGVGLEHADAPMHDLLSRALDHLDCKEPTLRAMFHFEKGLAEVLGIAENKKSAEATLGGHLGQLPASRKQLVERLGPPM
ncbi:MAG: recombination protein O N-terminal domain-containing protein [Armatimonadetes bacterium]|nr:recombination protein O N-terminal domain-containing protein [Akkermansiaceae bacterium]